MSDLLFGNEAFWNSIATFIQIVTIGVVFLIITKAYKNIISAHKKPDVYQTIEYKNCQIYPEKVEL